MIDTKEIRKALAIHGVDVLNEDEVLDVLDRLEAAEQERDALRAKIEAMERQKPVKIQHRVPFLDSNGECVGYTTWKDGRGFNHWPHRSLYLAPGAKGEDK